MQMSKFFELAIVDSMLDSFNVKTTEMTSLYPPHNILKFSDNRFVLEIAVAGFKQEDLKIVLDKNNLIITGDKKKNENVSIIETSYLHKGIGTRSFEKSFVLERYLNVQDISLSDGILSIVLERVIPEEELPKVLEIG